MAYVDISIVPVARDRRAEYIVFSRRMAQVYRDHGALRIVDYWQTDETPQQSEFHAEGLSYDAELPGLDSVMGAAEFEAVVVTVTEWPSRDARDRGAAAATSDPRVLATLEEDPVFDGGRVTAASFEVAMDMH